MHRILKIWVLKGKPVIITSHRSTSNISRHQRSYFYSLPLVNISRNHKHPQLKSNRWSGASRENLWFLFFFDDQKHRTSLSPVPLKKSFIEPNTKSRLLLFSQRCAESSYLLFNTSSHLFYGQKRSVEIIKIMWWCGLGT